MTTDLSAEAGTVAQPAARSAAEILSPAGDWDALRAAVANGADAVYFGLSNFNARHRATNFTLDELPQVVDFLHQRNVRGYVACNTLIFSDELPEVARLIEGIAHAGADAVIVQDLGLVRLIRRLAPDLPIHASTQMTLTEPRGIELVRSLGVERVILARELSLADIQRIRSQTDMPLEVFVHGALCVAYSGQCLTSEALGGRSANRGQCAQACRLPYDLIVDGERREMADYAYLLSPQDLAAFDIVDDLVQLGVCSLKIEGRLKSAEYVAVTTRTYRAALDAALEARTFELDRPGRLDLEQSFSRGLMPGFLEGTNHQRLVHGRFPKSRGIFVGTVSHQTARGVIIELAAQHGTAAIDGDAIVKAGDGIVFDQGHPEQDEQGGRLYEVKIRAAGEMVRAELTFARETINLAAVAPGSLVWKTDDPAWRRRVRQTFSRDIVSRRTGVSFRVSGVVGGPLRVSARDADGNMAEVHWPGPLELARRHPITRELLEEQLGRLGDTPYQLRQIELDLPDPVMAPKSVLNDLRRQIVQALDAARAKARPRRIYPQALAELRGEVSGHRSANLPGLEPRLYVLARTAEQLRAVLDLSATVDLAGVYCDFEDVRRYADAVATARQSQFPIGLATLRIVKPGEEGLLAKIAQAEPDSVLIRNFAALDYFRTHSPHIARIGDFSLNVANELSADLFVRQGFSRLVPSYDLNWDQFRKLLMAFDPSRFEAVVHQHMPMFHMEHCVFAATLSDGKDWRDCGRPCDRHRVELKDRMGANFPLLADAGCRNTVFNAVPQSGAEYVARMLSLGVRHFRLDLLRETPSEARELVQRYCRVLSGEEDGRNTWRSLQVLNQLGVTRGTLDG